MTPHGWDTRCYFFFAGYHSRYNLWGITPQKCRTHEKKKAMIGVTPGCENPLSTLSPLYTNYTKVSLWLEEWSKLEVKDWDPFLNMISSVNCQVQKYLQYDW